MLSIRVCFQVLKDRAELGESVSQKVGILKEVAALTSFHIEPANGEQQRDYPELGAKQREDIEEKENDGQGR